MTLNPPDPPWIFRTYAGHSSASASNALFRRNLSRGQTGLSVAFDLPTQTGRDPDHPMARTEVGKVGTPVSHLGDMDILFRDIPLERMNTSMTINATAPWLLALYVAAAEKQGIPRARLRGTTQNDILKEYLSRGAYIFPPGESIRLTLDMIQFCNREMPGWNPLNICSYHLQEAGATPVQELAFSLANATAILDLLREREADHGIFSRSVGQISFFVNAGMHLVTEICKMRAFVRLWDEICLEYGVTDPKHRRFRYGVQVNSLGLTRQQPENNVYRILIEALAVILSRNARARAVQLPAWNEALGLPRPWDQQWSLRLQQILALETDLLAHGDLFDGSPVIAGKVDALCAGAREELARIRAAGGTLEAIRNGSMKEALVRSNALRLSRIESGERKVVGVNCHTESWPSPLLGDGEYVFLQPDPDAEREELARITAHRESRDGAAVAGALEGLRSAARDGGNIMPPSITCAMAGVTTGEWADALREVFGEYRAPTGISGHVSAATRQNSPGDEETRRHVAEVARKVGAPLKILIGKPGLDGHSNGAEQIALKAMNSGFEVVYEGGGLPPWRIIQAAIEENVHLVGVSLLSGSHMSLLAGLLDDMRAAGLGGVPLVAGGIISPGEAKILKERGVAAVYTPENYDLNFLMRDMADVIARHALRA